MGYLSRPPERSEGSATTLTYDAKGNTYTFQYDLLHRKTRMTYPGSAADYEAWTYHDTASTTTPMLVYRARDGSTMSCTYDHRGRETFCDYSDPATPDITTAYDAAGRKTSCSTSTATHTYTYDAAHQLLSETTQFPSISSTFTVAYTYNPDGLRSSMSYPEGTVVNYTYTARNQLKEVKRGSSLLAAYTYDPAGNRLTKTLANGLTATATYDAKGQLTLLTHQKGSAPQAAFGYTYNLVGNRTSKVVNMQGVVRTETYTHDPVDQVTGVNYGNSRTESFVYDAVGNRLSATDSAVGTTTYTTNALNQYTSLTASSVSSVVQYDAKGNLSQLGTTWTYTYDSKNRLLSAVSSAQGVNLVMTYDCHNKVVSRTLNGTTRYYLYDGWSLIAEVNSTGGLVKTYIHSAVIDKLLVQTQGTTDAFYSHDALGSTVLLTDASGNVVRAYEYDAFGKVQNPPVVDGMFSPDPYANRFLYTGREFLQEVSLTDYRNRVYSADLGRFLQSDPIRFDAGDVNLYRYVFNASTKHLDPYGLAVLLDDNGNPQVHPSQEKCETHNDEERKRKMDEYMERRRNRKDTKIEERKSPGVDNIRTVAQFTGGAR